jgi:HEAT repeat protein
MLAFFGRTPFGVFPRAARNAVPAFIELLRCGAGKGAAAVCLLMLVALAPQQTTAGGLPSPATKTENPSADALFGSAVQVAEASFKAGDIYDRLLAAGTLAETGNGPALEFLKTYLGSDDLVFKRATIDTLLASTHPLELDLLYRAAESDPSTLGLMMESLAATPRADMEDLISEALREGSSFVRKNAVQAIARGRVEGLNEQLRDLIADQATHETVRAYAYYALVSLGDGKEVSDRLFALVKSEQVEEREVAAIAMGLYPASETGKRLKTLMADRSDERVSLAATASSAGQGDDEAIGRLIKGVAYGKPMEASILAGALKRLPPKTAAQITEVLMTCCKLTADAATRVLESWSGIEADPAPVYAWGLAHEEADVRLQTTWLIGHRRDAEALALLGPLLHDEDAGIRTMAAWSVVQCVGAQGTLL